jgi:thiosulfate/3-mercaptopyruvate sulfurtransferase
MVNPSRENPMAFQSIISTDQLRQILGQPDLVILDCRFDLQAPDQGKKDYTAAHIPGASYAHLDNDLSGRIEPGVTGRHPLPEPEKLAEKFSAWGIDDSVQVVVYDYNHGGLAARLWWLLRWLGHESAAVLSGGWDAWVDEDHPVEHQLPDITPRDFEIKLVPDMMVDANYVDQIRLNESYILVDSRPPERYWALEEPIDPIAGHIPGALSAPYAGNLDDQSRFLPSEDLKERFTDLIQGLPASQVVFYCGSGVTAAHNVLAMVNAGFDIPKLYPGSWSEWITDPTRPVEP